MLYKSRSKPEELLVLEYLDKRMALPETEKSYYLNLKKGFEGGIMFDSLTGKLETDLLVLNDLLLRHNKTTFQIDTLIISSNKIFFYEIKNYEGDHIYEADKLYKFPKTEITNPLNQLRRSETLLKQLIFSLGINLPVEGIIVFINPEFTLYQAPLNCPFLLPTQLKSYLQKLESSTTSKLTNKHQALAEKLVSLHLLNIKENKYSNLPSYEFDQVRKGISCEICKSFSVSVTGHNIKCTKCGYVELASSAILRNINEFMTLFRNEKLTTNVIYDWCQVIPSKRRIRKVLIDNFKIVGCNQWTYYL
ncbi:nuclease-related domain-containing protein [Ureibacillus manganicus]|uniref:Nuclease n=1 Tax=Ureibacillus manganicus DSM 26584 TaxID=1384049 RepID=A0A0A3I9A3_9BACL|nr:nuclease-related domain-containing protein [Ureibacillus manganicus]KGR79358.1 nuclease [Ureibacillus manganicus DSM 26584]